MEILSDYYRINNVKDLNEISESQASFETESQKSSPQKPVEKREDQLKKWYQETKKKFEKKGNKQNLTVVEKIMSDIKNIEFCIEHYIQVAKSHANVKYSAIQQNNNQHIQKDPSFNNIRSSLVRASSYQNNTRFAEDSLDSDSTSSENSQEESRILGNALCVKKQDSTQSYLTRTYQNGFASPQFRRQSSFGSSRLSGSENRRS